MKSILTALIFLTSIITYTNASAQSYDDFYTIETAEAVQYFEACWTVVKTPTYLGTYCQNVVRVAPVPTPSTDGLPIVDVVIFSANGDSNVFFYDEGDGNCTLLRATPILGNGTDYLIWCKTDEIFKGNFESN